MAGLLRSHIGRGLDVERFEAPAVNLRIPLQSPALFPSGTDYTLAFGTCGHSTTPEISLPMRFPY